MRGKIAYVFPGIAFLGPTYPLLGVFERGAYETLKIKTDPGYFLNFRCPLDVDFVYNWNITLTAL